MSTAGQKRRHVPLRRCVVCGERRTKQELIRLVRAESGVDVDETGRAPGRGAYMCPDEACAARMLKRIEVPLRVRLDQTARDELENKIRIAIERQMGVHG